MSKHLSSSIDWGLRFIVEPQGTALTADEQRLLSELRPAGVMFRRRNFLHDVPYNEWLEAYRRLLDSIYNAIGRASIIVSIDHEGGRVHRTPEPITRFPYPAFYGASLPAVEAVGRAMGVELRSLGINLSFAPVCDIHSNPENPVIHHRAFGQTAAEVSERALRFAQGLQNEGVLPCIKHFPGHGDTSSDSHYSLPIVDRSLEQLRERELRPFASLISNGIPMVMSAHITLPQVDPNNQATLSKRIMGDLLRGELKFDGVVVADALGMGAIKSDVDSSSFVARANDAGIDLLLMVGDSVTISDAVRCRDDFVKATASGEIDKQLALESQIRIEQLLNKIPKHVPEMLPDAVLNHHHQLRDQLSNNAEWSKFDLHLPGFE